MQAEGSPSLVHSAPKFIRIISNAEQEKGGAGVLLYINVGHIDEACDDLHAVMLTGLLHAVGKHLAR